MMCMRFGHSGPARVLVVDDERLIALTTAAILSSHGYDVHTAFSGEQAVAEAAGFNPDLVISDVSMFRMNGIEAAVMITGMFPDCKVLFLSGEIGLDDASSAFPEDLVYSVARKPMRVEDLLDCVATLLSAVEAVESQAAAPSETALSFGNKWMVALGKSHSAGPDPWLRENCGSKNTGVVNLDLAPCDKAALWIQ